jgi:riboflavin synthase alpha subunit
MDMDRAKRRDSFRRPEQKMMQTKNVNFTPKVSLLLNQCRAKRMEYRIISKDDERTKEDYKRMTIVINDEGDLVAKYYG